MEWRGAAHREDGEEHVKNKSILFWRIPHTVRNIDAIMQLAKWKKIVLGVLGTIVLGAFGSGLWDVALKPSGLWLGRLILTIVTLGSTRFRDQIYREAARGNHEAGAMHVLFFVVLVLVNVFLLLSFFDQIKGSATRYVKKLEAEIDGLETDTKLAILRKKLQQLERVRAISRMVGIGCAILFATVTFIQYLQLNQANAAYTFFTQSITICRPYLDENHARMIESRYAAMNGRDDYLGIIGDLKQISEANHRKLPDFTPW